MTNRPIKVLQVTHALGMGGAETWLMEVLRRWRKQGGDAPQMDFLATGGERGIFDDEALALGAKIYYLQYRKKRLGRFARGYRRILKRGEYTAVHDHQDYASGWHYLMAGRYLPAVRITHVHNPAYQILNNYGVTVRRRVTAAIGKSLVARYATHITGTSRQIIGEYGFDEKPFAHIPRRALHCGFDPIRFSGDPSAAKTSVCKEFGWPETAKIILFAGRTDHSPDLGHPRNHKNSGFALAVALECAMRDPCVHMVFCGAPSEATPVMRGRIRDAGLGDRIKLAGIRQDIERFLIGADVLLFPSRGEGLGMVAVEAQAAGVPVLASTAVPAECVVLPELVKRLELENGLQSWVTQLLSIMGAARVDAGAANRRIAESAFSIEYSTQALACLYSGEDVDLVGSSDRTRVGSA